MPEQEDNPWVTHGSKAIYSNPWIEVTEFDVTTPGGSPGIYGKVHFKNVAVGVVPVDEEGCTWVVGQYRYVLDAYSWEIPEGGAPLDEEPLAAAKRELLEETGLEANTWKQILGPIHLSNSVSDEVAFSFLATGLTQGESCPEDTEDLAVTRMPLSEAIAMAEDGRITDALSVLSLMKLKGISIPK